MARNGSETKLVLALAGGAGPTLATKKSGYSARTVLRRLQDENFRREVARRAGGSVRGPRRCWRRLPSTPCSPCGSCWTTRVTPSGEWPPAACWTRSPECPPRPRSRAPCRAGIGTDEGRASMKAILRRLARLEKTATQRNADLERAQAGDCIRAVRRRRQLRP